MSLVPFCHWCDTTEGDLVLIAIEETGSRGGASKRACEACAERVSLLPLAEHPPGSLGGVRYRTRAAQ